MQIKVGMFILMVNDVDKATEFYKKIGLPLKFHLENKWAEFTIKDIKLGICPAKFESFDHHTGIVLEVDNIKEFQEQILKENIQFLRDIVEAPHGLMASIKDPSGNIIDIYEPTPEKLKEFTNKFTQEKETEGE